MSDTFIIEAREVSLIREGRAILDTVSVTIPTGAFVSIIGPNGAGKSTLMRVLCGLLKPDRGSVILDGRPLQEHSRREVAARMSYVPQSPPENIPFTVQEFVGMARYVHGGLLGGLDTGGRAAVEDALSLTGCAAFRNRILQTLSGGEARKVHLAAALAQGGDILLLDEPTTHLDYRHQREVVRLLRRAHTERGLTVVAVQHDLNQGVPLSDMVIALKDGALFHTGPAADMLRAEKLEALFGTPFHVVELPGDATLVLPRHD